MRERHVSLAASLALSIVLGCATESTPLDATFNAPTGLVVAGAEEDPRLFIANAGEGRIRVLNLGEDGLRDVQFEESRLIYFPLEMEAGGDRGYPTTLVRSGDGAYVLALDSGLGVLHLIDAQELTHEHSYHFSDLDPTAQPGTRFSAVAARACEAPCEGEFVVALGGTSQVATLRLSGAPGAKPLLELVHSYEVGEEVLGMALDPNGSTLYLSTVSRAPEGGAGQHGLKSLSLGKGTVTGVDLPWSPGTLAVSTAGTVLLVTRPEQQDVVLFAIKEGTLATEPLDTNGRIGPELSCLGACVPGEEEVECGGHASVAALCSSEGGVELREREYRGVYLPGIPSTLLPLGVAGGQPALRVPCEDDSQASFERVYSDYALVATLDGVIRYIGLDLEGDEEDFTPELVSFGWCRQGHLKPALPSGAGAPEVAEALRLNSLALAPCPEVPGRKRFECLALETDDAPDEEPDPHGAVAFGGLTYFREVRLDWEGSVNPSLARSRGGEVTDEGDFTDVFYSLGQHAEEIREGDILEITSAVELTPECREALGITEDDGLTSQCQLERRVVEGPTLESPVLRLDEPLPGACFEPGGKVGYRVRMGDAFLVTVSPGGAYRVRPGERFGPGGQVGRGEPVLFDLAPGSIPLDLSPCDRYDGAGRPVASIPSVFRRTVANELVAESVDHTFGFGIADRDYAGNLSTYNLGSGLIVETGLKLETEFSQTAISGTAGVLPGAMIVADSWRKDLEPVVVVSYTGRNSVLAMVPYTPDLSADRFEAGNYFLLE